MTRFDVAALVRISLVCADLDRTERFYAALGFVRVARGSVADLSWHDVWGTAGRSAVVLRMQLGEQEVEFVRFEPPGADYPAGSTSTDLWFQHFALVVADMDEAAGRVRALAATPISRAGPERLPPSTGGVAAYKFRDPDGHPLELLQFPPGIGDPRWHVPGKAVFRGIDHSAIAVADAARSARFYQDVLGLRPGQAAVNHGPEQERLDDLDADAVDIMPLAPADSPTSHVEVLGYRVGLRRPAQPDAGPADIAATRMVFRARRATGEKGAEALGAPSAVPLVDPDGHRLVIERAGA